jgi:hypothetical protein
MDLSPPNNESTSAAYDQNMVNPQAAVMVLDHIPDAGEVTEIASHHLEDFPAEEAHATCELVYEPPTWLDVHERDQMGAFMRDGAACILIVYMREGNLEEDDDA